MAKETVVGLDQWLKDLDRLALTVRRKLIVKALREGTKPTEEEMKRRAPDDPTTPGSRIEDNIATNVVDQTATGAAALTGPTAHAFFAGFSEFGTAHQSERPFIGPAFDATVDEATEIISEVLDDGIEKELKRGA